MNAAGAAAAAADGVGCWRSIHTAALRSALTVQTPVLVFRIKRMLNRTKPATTRVDVGLQIRYEAIV